MLGEVAPSLSQITGVSHRFFSRVGGTSPRPWTGLNTSLTVMDAPARVQENLARIRFQIGVASDALLSVTQVHGNEVIEVKELKDISDVSADGLFTQLPHVALAVRTADCVPILMTDKEGRFVAALHAGWRSAVADIMGTALAKIKTATGVASEDVVVAIGPCIGKDSFEVGDDVKQMANALLKSDEFFTAKANGKYMFDLRSFIQVRFAQLGVVNVDHVGGCTYSDTETYFSHRAEKGNTGRQMSVIALCEPPVAFTEAESMELPEPTI